MHDNMKIWENLKQVPPTCVKQIQAGRLKGMTDIKPQWRIQAMTNQFGPCGIGWKYTIDKQWIEHGSDGNVFAFVNISLFFKHDSKWSDAIPGTGGSMLIVKEKNGLHNNDESYKMALTDALSVAMKSIGVAADIYLGAFDGSKYNDTSYLTNDPIEKISSKQISELTDLILESGSNESGFLQYMGVEIIEDITTNNYEKGKKALLSKIERMKK